MSRNQGRAAADDQVVEEDVSAESAESPTIDHDVALRLADEEAKRWSGLLERLAK